MILFLWIKEYQGIKNLGINLTSRYNFEINERPDGSYDLFRKENKAPDLFKEYVWDIKAILGKNGVGKSRILACLIQNLMSDIKVQFNGVLITDKYLLNRSDLKININFTLEGDKLTEIGNENIVNYSRKGKHQLLTKEKAENHRRSRIIDTYLKDYLVIYYSPIINYDRVWEADYAIAGNEAFEVDYTKYIDISSEAQIISDRRKYTELSNLDLNGESELLCHKSLESARILNYIVSHKNLPIDINLSYVTVHLNYFSLYFWDKISRLFVTGNDTYSEVSEVFLKFEKSNVNDSKFQKFKTAFLLRVCSYLLRYIANERFNSKITEDSNPIVEAVNEMKGISKASDTLDEFLKKICLSFVELKNFSKLNSEINSFLKFLENSIKSKDLKYSDTYIEVPVWEEEILKKILQFTSGLDVGKGIFKQLNIPIFSIEFGGLSSGEKAFLQMLSRIYANIRYINKRNTKNIVFLLDEPEIAFHPEWQLDFINKLLKFIKEEFEIYKCQVILTSHSPLIISDFPAHHLVFLDRNNEGTFVSRLNNIQNTFAANIHAIYTDAFFLKKGTIGEFAKRAIKDAIEIINTKDIEKKEFAQNVINLVGDDLIRNQLQELYDSNFLKLESLEEQYASLIREAERVKDKIQKAK